MKKCRNVAEFIKPIKIIPSCRENKLRFSVRWDERVRLDTKKFSVFIFLFDIFREKFSREKFDLR